MASTTKAKPERKCRLERDNAGETVLVLSTVTAGPRIGVRTEVSKYIVRSLDSDWGRAFELTKLTQPGEEPAAYDVLINHQNLDPEEGGHACECLGHLGHRGAPCKHIRAICSLMQAGRLPV